MSSSLGDGKSHLQRLRCRRRVTKVMKESGIVLLSLERVFDHVASHTCYLQTRVGNAADKEEELKVAQKGLEAMKEEVALKAKALEDRDKERAAARERASWDLEVSKRCGSTASPFFLSTLVLVMKCPSLSRSPKQHASISRVCTEHKCLDRCVFLRRKHRVLLTGR